MARISKGDLIKLQKKLKTDAAIGDKFGITRQAVHQIRKKFGIDSVIARNDERNKKISDMYKSGKSGIVIAEKFGLSIPHTYRVISNLGKGKKSKKR